MSRRPSGLAARPRGVLNVRDSRLEQLARVEGVCPRAADGSHRALDVTTSRVIAALRGKDGSRVACLDSAHREALAGWVRARTGDCRAAERDVQAAAEALRACRERGLAAIPGGLRLLRRGLDREPVQVYQRRAR